MTEPMAARRLVSAVEVDRFAVTQQKDRTRSYRKILLFFFLLSLPIANPIVHGDGVGYYAYARAPLIQHDLHFEEDWRRANLYFSQSRTQADGRLNANQYTQTGFVGNLFTVGPAILWAPFLVTAHAVVLVADHFGAHVATDGFSAPYKVAMVVGTAFCGFLGLLLSFTLAGKYVQPRWAFLATLGIWTASSLPVYMYFNPAWSHAHSAFVVALFLWFWDRTRPERTTRQWLLLGLLSGLLLDVYLPNGVFLLLPCLESIRSYWQLLRLKSRAELLKQFSGNAAFVLTMTLAFLPTLITRRIIFGGFFRFGAYSTLSWDWSAPHWRSVLFSSDHGLLSWTPLLGLSLAGLFFPTRMAKATTAYCAISALAFYYVIASYPYWDGMASFGNRFFISLTPIFVFGLALFLERIERLSRSPRQAYAAAAVLLGIFALWNAGFIFQWGAHLIPPRGPISWSSMVRNQFVVVPRQITENIHAYFFRRSALMKSIEQKDIEQLKSTPPDHP